MKYLKTTVEDGIGIITIDHPPVNALSSAVFAELDSAVAGFQADPAVRAIVLTAEGAVFAAGADIREIADIADAATGEQLSWAANEFTLKLDASPLPIVCAVNGPCLGGGMELAMACHIRIASDRARFAQPEVKIGIIPGMGGSQRLPRLVGRSQALEILLTGDMISAPQAKAVGLVNAVVPEAELRRAAVGLARKIAANSKAVVANILRAVRDGDGLPIAGALRIESKYFGDAMTTADKKEGVAAFMEKRQPKFTDA